ncbi:MAG TPA: helix-turn-helix domain-containing protein [Ohtaekwangia sp.]|nr:helix-turn-helix domain-containing protein [Ohtaekwangia sp.]
MSEPSPNENDFIAQLTAIVEQNISDEGFGVSELADKMSMSRSNLLRKVTRETKLSVSQFINQVRLKKGMELLRKSSLNVSEVSHQVGFNSTSYFIKCFREYYGYPPGEVGKRDTTEPVIENVPAKKPITYFVPGFIAVVLMAAGITAYFFFNSPAAVPQEKSIAVLPFKNDSNDSSNVYLINGLMESTLNNLQQINGLRVVSRTSAEKYRNANKSIQEMAEELNVNYFVEGSGQKIGDRILLNIQLIEASTDRHLWAKQYRRESKDIFELQQEIAENIAEEIEIVITPEVAQRIEKKPTNDLVAYDLFLKGRDLFHKSGTQDLLDAIPYFNQAIERDNEFSLAYANAVMVYYYLDVFSADKKYNHQIHSYADKAMLYDPKAGESLIAKALSFATQKDYESATLFLEKALEYNTNYGLVIHFLTEFYSIHVPNSRKYLEYALIGAKHDIELLDSAAKSFKYFHLANGLVQNGFIDEAQHYMNVSLDYDSNNFFACYVNAYVGFAKTKDFKQTREHLLKELNKNPNRLDIMQEVAKVTFYMREYKEAYVYYEKYLDLKEKYRMDLFSSEDLKIAIVLDKLNQHDRAIPFVNSFKAFAEKDKSMYRNLFLASYYAYQKDNAKALEYLKLFSNENNFQYWILYMDTDPVFDHIKDLPEFKEVMRTINKKFQDTHEELEFMLKRNPLPKVS